MEEQAIERQSMHGEWSSRWAFILAAAGAAVGLGNIWKFPYIAGENGGGAFVLVYLICITLIGFPLMMTEIMLGRRGRQNPMNSMAYLATSANKNKSWGLVGLITVLSGFLILSYYSVIAGWALDYVYQSAAGHFTGASANTIDQIFENLLTNTSRLMFWHSAIMVLTTLVVAYGVQRGIERAVVYLFPAMVLLLIVIASYSYQTGYFGHGLKFLFHPDFHKLTAQSILIAMGHAFFTLSLATGSIMMYGAYLPKQTSIPKSAFYIALADTLIALLAGLAIFPIVFANGLQPGAGPGLIFKTLPIAFGQMPYGQLFATIFFTMLVFAAYTSALSLLEPSVAWLMENFGVHRLQAACIAGGGVWFLGIGTVLSFGQWHDLKIFGKSFFDALDYLTANLMLPLAGLLIAVFAAWKLPKQVTLSELNFKNGYYLSWLILIGVLAPIIIALVFFHVIGLV